MLGDKPRALPLADLAGQTGRLVGEQHVLRNRQVGHQRQFLERRLNAMTMGLRWRSQLHLRSVDADLARVGAHQPT